MVNENKFTTSFFAFADTPNAARILATTHPNKLTSEKINILTSASPITLTSVLGEALAHRNDTLVGIVAGVAIAGAQEAMDLVPPRPDVAKAFMDVFHEAVRPLDK